MFGKRDQHPRDFNFFVHLLDALDDGKKLLNSQHAVVADVDGDENFLAYVER